MAWIIKCGDEKCGDGKRRSETWTQNIDDLKRNHCDTQGWFLCGKCGSRGYIPKQFKIQEGGEWKPYLKGIIQPRQYDCDAVYQPFAFLVSSSPEAPPEDVWFAYYKDLRTQGGRLKMGYGPGGPPVFSAEEVLDLVAQMVKRGCLDAGAVKSMLESAARKP